MRKPDLGKVGLGAAAICLGFMASPLLAAVPNVPATETRTSRFEYDPATGLLVKEIVEPSAADLCVATEYVHDAYGNRTSATTRNCNASAGEAAAPAAGSVAIFAARTTSTTYDPRGQFPVTVTNALNQSETHSYDARFGTPLSLRGPNQLTTTWQYDGFGRKTLEQRADGTSSSWSYLECFGLTSCQYRYAITATTSGAPSVTKHFDVFGRESVQLVSPFSGTTDWRQQQNYDARGRVISKTRAFLSGNKLGQLNATTTFEYDLLNRVITVLDPIPQSGEAQPITRTYYEGLRTTVVDALGHSKSVYRNIAGQQERVVDHLGGAVRYGYDAFGNLVGTDAQGVFAVIKYDLRGRKIEMIDPDMGTWRYENDALGQLKKQTNAKGQITTLDYDLLGRMTQRTEPDLISSWEYDNNRAECANGSGKAIGKLSRAATSANYSRIHCYDNYARAASERTTHGAETFVSAISYDSFSRVDVTTYPTGYQVRNTYQNGYLRQVVQVASGTALWQANSMSPNGELLTESLGNGVATTRSYDNLGRLRSVGAGSGNVVQNTTFGFDAIGNLSGRTWVIDGIARSETFAYDEINRLRGVSGANGPPTKSYSYDAQGNVATKTEVGTYYYHPATHKLNFIQGSVNGITNPSFSFDANGNLTSGAGYTTSWTSFDKPLSIAKTGGAITSAFTYGPEHQRIRQIAGAITTLYFGAYERDANTNGLIEHKHYISAGGALIAQYTTRSTGPTNELRYLHRDHLGSVAAVTNEAGAVVVRYSYDAWGKRRNPSGADEVITAAAFDRGYTGHEMLDSLQLVHMNGRVYDPLLARFVSADPHVPDAGNLQAFNRFAYVFDNPLSFTDPSGYKPNWFKQVVFAVVAIVASYYTAGAASSAVYGAYGVSAEVAATTATSYGVSVGTLASVAGGAAGGFVGGFIASGGDIKAAAQGALTGGVFGAIGAEFAGNYEASLAAHAAAGCGSAVLQGGKCGQGAAAQLISKFITVETRSWGAGPEQFTAAVVAGGTVSIITGGKFGNGAYTAAFGYLFNELSSWQRAEQIGADALRASGWTVEERVKVILRALPGELDAIGFADFIATKNGEVLIGEVKDGLSAKLTSFQKALLQSEGALGRLEIVSAERALALGIEAGKPLAAQLSVGARLMYTLTGELGGRAGRQWAARNSGALATRILFNGLRVIGSVPVMLLTEPGN